MLDKGFFQKLREILLNYALGRREIIKISDDIRQLSKKAIFAFQRDDRNEAETLLKHALEKLGLAQKMAQSDERLLAEGSYKAALEEYVEAELFGCCLRQEKISQIKNVSVPEDIYIGGLCDVPGELYRYAIKSATEKNFDKVKECQQTAEEIINELLDMDLTGYNRQKFDQAKQALQKLEQVVYETSLRS